MRIVNDSGELFLLTEGAYRRYLIAGVNAENVMPAACDFGKCIGVIAFHGTKAHRSDFKEALATLKYEKSNRS